MYKIKHNIYSAGFQKQQQKLLWVEVEINKEDFTKEEAMILPKGTGILTARGLCIQFSTSITGSTLSPPSISDNSAFSFLHPLPLDPVREMPEMKTISLLAFTAIWNLSPT